MTTKPKALKYRVRRNEAGNASAADPSVVADESDAPAAAPEPEAPQRKARVVQRGAAAAAAQAANTATTPDAATVPAPGNAPPRAGGGAQRQAKGGGAKGQAKGGSGPVGETDIDAIRAEGLTGRQLRMASRIAQKHGLNPSSDFDAVRQLRLNGIDPFRRSNILELVVPEGAGAGTAAQMAGAQASGAADAKGGTASGVPSRKGGGGGGGKAGRALAKVDKAKLPQTVSRDAKLPSKDTGPAPNPAADRAAEILEIQQDIARRRRRNLTMLFARLGVFVGLPTLLVGWYFAVLATPMFATNSEFVIQQAEGQAAGGLGSMFSGTSMATQQDSISVQSFLTSRDALLRLDQEEGFKDHFSGDNIDVLRRLEPDATNEQAYKLYEKMVRVSYDPTEGLLRMEVIAADPETSQRFSEALIGYAEDRVDQLTQRVREDAMQGARQSYQDAEQRRQTALQAWLSLQQELNVVDPVGETSVKTQQIAELEGQRQQLQLELQTRLSVRRPNEAQVAALESQITNIDLLITDLRADLTAVSADGVSAAVRNAELRLAEENYTFETTMVQQALQAMETARIEANRQVRYLETGVTPVAPDEATYPKVFENTVLAFLIFSGIYLMISLTASILREQVSS